ncbi:MAG: hypothetical protein ACLU4R_06510 [Lachnospiraceae bacterium]
MRLIDADKLMLHLNDYALQESPSNVESADDRKISRAVYKAITDCIEAVNEQPTAFDVDKVINELKRDKFIESECILSDVHQGYNAGLSKAIEIVKGGGVPKWTYHTRYDKFPNSETELCEFLKGLQK